MHHHKVSDEILAAVTENIREAEKTDNALAAKKPEPLPEFAQSDLDAIAQANYRLQHPHGE